jgi:hypothetical protein
MMNESWRERNVLLSAFVVAFALFASACAAQILTPPPPTQIVDLAAQKLLRTQSLHFVIDFTGQPTFLDLSHTLALRHVEGDIQRPDRMRATVKASLPGVFVQIQAIGIGEEQFATNPLNGQWQKIPTEWGFDPTLLFESKSGLAAILSDVQNLSALPDETLDNQRHYHLRGQIAGTKISSLTGWLVGEGVVRFELWAGANDLYIRRIRLIDESNAATQTAGTPLPPATWNMELSQFDVPVKIERPQF